MSGAPSPSSPLIISYILFFTTTTTLFFFFFFVLPIAGQSAGGESVRNTRDPRCYSFYCGDVEIRYPFWNSSDAGTGYCGYPNMGIHCHDGSQAILTLGGGLYRVSDVRYNTSTVTLQDVDVLGSDCPRAVHNLTLPESVPLAETEADDNLLFFFNCSGVLHLPDAYKIPCLARNGSNDSYVFQEGSMPPEAYPWGLCQRFLMLPVLRTAIPPSTAGDLLSSFGRALQRGFQLQWRQPSMVDCVSCEASGGNCGYTYNEAAQGYDFLCSCNDGTRARNCREGATRRKKMLIGIIIMGISGFVLLSSVIFWYWHRTDSPKARAIFNRKSKTTQNVEAFLEQYGSAVPKRYAYAEVKRITKSFSEKLGHGGCGVVFKGKLLDGRLVAVKVLNKSKDNIEEFVNEVASIGLTHHVNIVSLLGFCCEGSKRALVYEFMNHGSLDKFIFSKAPQDMTPVRWDKLYNIAIGIARGLEYLHRGCSTRIVHFDIKPHNILLDEDLCPKISDFGLAKSCHPNQSILSIADARGTVGYIAPEVFSRNFGVITSKSDVYSYGMMMLDMVGGGRNADASTDDASDMYFPHWVYEHFNEDDVLKPCGVTAETEEIARKMILVGLWCVQTNPSCRPSMRKVVEMLEGNVMDLQMPPKPYLSSPPLRSSINS